MRGVTEIAVPGTTNELGHRQQGEGAQAYAAFNLHRNLPSPRAIRQASDLRRLRLAPEGLRSPTGRMC